MLQFFMAAQRPRIKSENPEATFGELGKLAGAEVRCCCCCCSCYWCLPGCPRCSMLAVEGNERGAEAAVHAAAGGRLLPLAASSMLNMA